MRLYTITFMDANFNVLGTENFMFRGMREALARLVGSIVMPEGTEQLNIELAVPA